MIFRSVKKILAFLFSTVDTRVACYIYLAVLFKKYNLRLIGTILLRRLQRKYGVFLSYTTEFDSSLKLRHPVGIVIGEGVKLGKNVTIFQNVTLGRSDTFISAYPEIGDNTIIYAGAVLLGGIKIGRNCVIGANAVLTRDIPDGSVAAGVPARILNR